MTYRKYIFLNIVGIIGVINYIRVVPLWYFLLYIFFSNLLFNHKISKYKREVVCFWFIALIIFLVAFFTNFSFGIFYNVLFIFPSLYLIKLSEKSNL